MLFVNMLFGVIKESGADAHLVIVALKYVEMAAALAALPELRIVRQFAVRYGPETEVIIHLHYSSSCCD